MRFICIATHYSGGKQIGLRMLDYSTKVVYDASNENIIALLSKNDVVIDGVSIQRQRLVGNNGSLDRYTKIVNGNISGNSSLVVVRQIGDEGYEVSDWQGNIKRLRNSDVIKYAEENGIANGKLVTKEDGSKYISAIHGRYNTVDFKDTSAKGYLLIEDAGYNKVISYIFDEIKIQSVIWELDFITGKKTTTNHRNISSDNGSMCDSVTTQYFKDNKDATMWVPDKYKYEVLKFIEYQGKPLFIIGNCKYDIKIINIAELIVMEREGKILPSIQFNLRKAINYNSSIDSQEFNKMKNSSVIGWCKGDIIVGTLCEKVRIASDLANESLLNRYPKEIRFEAKKTIVQDPKYPVDSFGVIGLHNNIRYNNVIIPSYVNGLARASLRLEHSVDTVYVDTNVKTFDRNCLSFYHTVKIKKYYCLNKDFTKILFTGRGSDSIRIEEIHFRNKEMLEWFCKFIIEYRKKTARLIKDSEFYFGHDIYYTLDPKMEFSYDDAKVICHNLIKSYERSVNLAKSREAEDKIYESHKLYREALLTLKGIPFVGSILINEYKIRR